MKRFIALALVLALFALLPACASQTAPAEPADQAAEEPVQDAAPAEPTEEAEEIRITYGLSQSEAHLGSQASIYFADYITERDPSIQFDIYFDSQLGDEATMLQSLMTGSIDMMGVSFSTLSASVPEMNIMSLPFFFGSPENFCKVMRDETFFNMCSGLIDESMGIHPVGVLGVFVRSIANTEHTVRTPEDVEGLKIRVMANQLYVDVFETLGASTVTLAFPEVFSGLQQGVVQGEDTGLETMVSNRYYEVEKYYSEVDYLYTGGYECCSDQLWNKLSDDQKALFIEAANAANDYFMSLRDEAYQGYVDTVTEAGVEIYSPTEEELTLFRDALQPIIEKYAFVSDDSTELYNIACEVLGY